MFFFDYFNRSAHSHFKILVYFFVCVFVMTILGSCTNIHCYVGGGSLLENLSQAFDDDYYITSIKTFCHMHTHTFIWGRMTQVIWTYILNLKKNIGYMKHISPYFDIHHRINNKTTAILIYSNILKIISKGKFFSLHRKNLISQNNMFRQ